MKQPSPTETELLRLLKINGSMPSSSVPGKLFTATGQAITDQTARALLLNLQHAGLITRKRFRPSSKELTNTITDNGLTMMLSIELSESIPSPQEVAE